LSSKTEYIWDRKLRKLVVAIMKQYSRYGNSYLRIIAEITKLADSIPVFVFHDTSGMMKYN